MSEKKKFLAPQPFIACNVTRKLKWFVPWVLDNLQKVPVPTNKNVKIFKFGHLAFFHHIVVTLSGWEAWTLCPSTALLQSRMSWAYSLPPFPGPGAPLLLRQPVITCHERPPNCGPRSPITVATCPLWRPSRPGHMTCTIRRYNQLVYILYRYCNFLLCCGSAFICCGSGSSWPPPCGSGSSCFLNSVPDPV